MAALIQYWVICVSKALSAVFPVSCTKSGSNIPDCSTIYLFESLIHALRIVYTRVFLLGSPSFTKLLATAIEEGFSPEDLSRATRRKQAGG